LLCRERRHHPSDGFLRRASGHAALRAHLSVGLCTPTLAPGRGHRGNRSPVFVFAPGRGPSALGLAARRPLVRSWLCFVEPSAAHPAFGGPTASKFASAASPFRHHLGDVRAGFISGLRKWGSSDVFLKSMTPSFDSQTKNGAQSTLKVETLKVVDRMTCGGEGH